MKLVRAFILLSIVITNYLFGSKQSSLYYVDDGKAVNAIQRFYVTDEEFSLSYVTLVGDCLSPGVYCYDTPLRLSFLIKISGALVVDGTPTKSFKLIYIQKNENKLTPISIYIEDIATFENTRGDIILNGGDVVYLLPRMKL